MVLNKKPPDFSGGFFMSNEDYLGRLWIKLDDELIIEL